MVVGQLNNIKVCFVIQARMNSSRLPGKVLIPMPLMGGKPLIQWIVDELKKSKLDFEIIVASSTNSENDILENYCNDNLIKFFRGDENDVLSRFIEITKNETPDVVVRLTGDNPILDITLLEYVISQHILNKNDYSTTEWLPIGMNMEVISPRALISLQDVETSQSEKEHVTLYFKNHNNYKRQIIRLLEDIRFSKLRLTVDYISDYLVVSQVLQISKTTNIFGIDLIIKIFEQYNWLFQGNINNIQKKTPVDLEDEFEIAHSVLVENELLTAARILRNYDEKRLSAR
jgi:spore coat polysaccharide biosynthesis protein SpsF